MRVVITARAALSAPTARRRAASASTSKRSSRVRSEAYQSVAASRYVISTAANTVTGTKYTMAESAPDQPSPNAARLSGRAKAAAARAAPTTTPSPMIHATWRGAVRRLRKTVRCAARYRTLIASQPVPTITAMVCTDTSNWDLMPSGPGMKSSAEKISQPRSEIAQRPPSSSRALGREFVLGTRCPGQLEVRADDQGPDVLRRVAAVAEVAGDAAERHLDGTLGDDALPRDLRVA